MPWQEGIIFVNGVRSPRALHPPRTLRGVIDKAVPKPLSTTGITCLVMDMLQICNRFVSFFSCDTRRVPWENTINK